MAFIIKDKAVVLNMDNVSTDQIFPGSYVNISDPKQMAEHVLEGADKTIRSRLQNVGHILVTGSNFGCGSSREQAVIALIEAGVRAVVAESVGRIWYRNAINLALPVIVCPDVAAMLSEGEELTVDLEEGTIIAGDGRTLYGEPVGDFVLNIFKNGGIKQLMLTKTLEEV